MLIKACAGSPTYNFEPLAQRVLLLQKQRNPVMLDEKRTVTPEKAVEILKKNGTVVTIEQAKIVLEFLYKIGKLSVEQYVKL